MDAEKRKPEEYKAQSFFGKLDLWLYVAVYDSRLCEKCEAYARQQVFRGSELRSTFPYCKIHDEDLILVKVHLHCRCQLLRIINPKRYLTWLQKLEEKK